ncbi:Reticulon [Cynara cardunculus var. scolymus]|uniref:Reticulon-like protein n=1 Tax=Cynara cardunculus var. scolymus TaxID=59895 RepID=A0A124SD44_CYNCS|nr:Reticulon [Cynara cardunculus var. scolymus]
MPEGITPENLINNIMDTLSDKHQKQNSGSFFGEEKSHTVTAQFNKLFGRQKPIHHILGGGKCRVHLISFLSYSDGNLFLLKWISLHFLAADVLLWRNKKISASVLSGATAVWVLFEWLDYNFLPLVCFGLVICIIGQFIWSHLLNRYPGGNIHYFPSLHQFPEGGILRSPPRLVLPDELVVNIATSVGGEVNHALGFLQNVGSRGDIKQLATVVGSLLAAAIIGTWCNFWTVIYIGFVAAHTLPVVYEKYDDQIDSVVYNVLGKLQNNYSKLDSSLLSRIPKAAGKKFA